ncbi:hypothetical protein TNCV_1312591 [Trichonephila clavipes]|nr:hypothetical protein TNCV_1312591 [Trichonephila clavipes]
MASLCSRIVDLLLRPSRKEKWGSSKKSIHFYSPLVHWANHVPSSGPLPMSTPKRTRWSIPSSMKPEHLSLQLHLLRSLKPTKSQTKSSA